MPLLFYHPLDLQEEAGSHRYNVGTDTPRFFATSLTGTPPAKSLLADSNLLSHLPLPPSNPPQLWRSLSFGESRHLQTSPSPLHRQLPLHLRQTSHHIKKEPPRSSTGIDLKASPSRKINSLAPEAIPFGARIALSRQLLRHQTITHSLHNRRDISKTRITLIR
jgi:hypothetical protein